jgi:hypothetical protein
MTPAERFDARPQDHAALQRAAPSTLDDARRAAARVYAAYFAGANNQHELHKVECTLYTELIRILPLDNDPQVPYVA